MDERDEALQRIDRAIEQAAVLLGEVGERGDLPTPCRDWSVADLVDHLVSSTRGKATMAAGGEVDWSAPTPHVEGDDAAAALRAEGEALREAYAAAPPDAPIAPDWALAELCCHTYDLAAALGHDTGGFDQDLAERGMAFVQANLTDENRGPAFGPAQSAPEGADAYQRLAAFAGREVG